MSPSSPEDETTTAVGLSRQYDSEDQKDASPSAGHPMPSATEDENLESIVLSMKAYLEL